jgi:hypothetical protein
MTPANEAWIREIAATDAIGTAAKIARICMEEIDSMRKQLKESSRHRPEKKDLAPVQDNPRVICITKERLELLEIRDHRLTRWDEWADQVIHGEIIPPMPMEAIRRRRKAGQA